MRLPYGRNLGSVPSPGRLIGQLDLLAPGGFGAHLHGIHAGQLHQLPDDSLKAVVNAMTDQAEVLGYSIVISYCA